MRKAVHVSLVTLLLITYIMPVEYLIGLNRLQVFFIATVVSSFFNSLQVKRPLFLQKILIDFRSTRQKILKEIIEDKILKKPQTYGKVLKFMGNIENIIEDFEERILEYIEKVERDYEKRSGYIGITFAIVAVTFTEYFFDGLSLYGVLALAIYDPLSAVVGVLIKTPSLPFSYTRLSGAFFASITFITALLLIGVTPLKALILTVVACIAEAYGIEDNLVLPITVSTVAFLIGL